MKTPKNKKEAYNLLKEKPWIIFLIAFLFIILSPLIKALGYVLLFGVGGFYLYKLYEHRKDETNK